MKSAGVKNSSLRAVLEAFCMKGVPQGFQLCHQRRSHIIKASKLRPLEELVMLRRQWSNTHKADPIQEFDSKVTQGVVTQS